MKSPWALSMGMVIAGACNSQGAPPDAVISPQAAPTRMVDLLLVIDNTELDKQTALDASFPQLVQALDALPGGRPDLHIGVVDTTVDLGVAGYGPSCPHPDEPDDGLLQNTARISGCEPPNGRFIIDVAIDATTRQTNYSGTLESTLGCIALVGAGGCGFEAPLAALQRALDGTRSENAGFRRDGAVLAVVVFTGADDCSTTDGTLFTLPDDQVGGHGNFRCALFSYACDQQISAAGGATYTGCTADASRYMTDPRAYAWFLETLVNPAQLVVTVIAGDAGSTLATVGTIGGELSVAPSCSATIDGNPSSARPGIRLAAFAHEIPGAALPTICQSNYGQPLADTAAEIGRAMNLTP